MRFALAAAVFCCLAAPLRADVRWQLECKPGPLGIVTARGVEGPGTYAWLTLTVSNRNGRDVPASLGVWATTDVAGRTYRGTVDPVVKEAVERRTGKKYKTLAEAREAPLADGAAVEIFVSLGKVDPSVDLLDVHVLGLADRVYRDRGKTLVEDKVLVLRVVRPGDEFSRQQDLLRLKSSKWTVLGPAKEIKRA
jgi:hypothetical protein